MMNKFLSWIFCRNIEMYTEADFLLKTRSFRDGITFFELIFNVDFYMQDHNPSLQFRLEMFNLTIFNIMIYNLYHVDRQ